LADSVHQIRKGQFLFCKHRIHILSLEYRELSQLEQVGGDGGKAMYQQKLRGIDRYSLAAY
jgi:hypothetical protein